MSDQQHPMKRKQQKPKPKTPLAQSPKKTSQIPKPGPVVAADGLLK